MAPLSLVSSDHKAFLTLPLDHSQYFLGNSKCAFTWFLLTNGSLCATLPYRQVWNMAHFAVWVTSSFKEAKCIQIPIQRLSWLSH
ncbi:hypothetical protein XENTR_v10007844 [Xenopus tropicalis]|nr:hypothetical protein XENTR_v10007844 [Xenopus tropicalis]